MTTTNPSAGDDDRERRRRPRRDAGRHPGPGQADQVPVQAAPPHLGPARARCRADRCRRAVQRARAEPADRGRDDGDALSARRPGAGSCTSNTCITCHGANLQGEQDRGPALIGVGSAAVYFQVSTGRMPLDAQSARGRAEAAEVHAAADRRARRATSRRTAAARSSRPSPTPTWRGGNPAQGGQLFRLNCASCHNFTGQGGALSSGKSAPSLQDASPSVIYTAMLSGPREHAQVLRPAS